MLCIILLTISLPFFFVGKITIRFVGLTCKSNKSNDEFMHSPYKDRRRMNFIISLIDALHHFLLGRVGAGALKSLVGRALPKVQPHLRSSIVQKEK
jgi:hypothetical protein